MAESVIRALRKRKLVKITLITVGKVKEKYLRDAIAEYSKRLGRYCKLGIVEVADEKTPEHASDGLERQIKAKEGERIAKHIRDDAFVIALAIEGKQLTSEQLAAKINDLGLHGTSHILFDTPPPPPPPPAISNSSSAAHWDSTPRFSNEPTTC